MSTYYENYAVFVDPKDVGLVQGENDNSVKQEQLDDNTVLQDTESGPIKISYFKNFS